MIEEETFYSILADRKSFKKLFLNNFINEQFHF